MLLTRSTRMICTIIRTQTANMLNRHVVWIVTILRIRVVYGSCWTRCFGWCATHTVVEWFTSFRVWISTIWYTGTWRSCAIKVTLIYITGPREVDIRYIGEWLSYKNTLCWKSSHYLHSVVIVIMHTQRWLWLCRGGNYLYVHIDMIVLM